MRDQLVDTLIVGGGPAGMSAALLLARCRRTIVLCDDGKPRNARSSEVHGLITAQRLTPAALRHAARAALNHYPNVQQVDQRVLKIVKTASMFSFETAAGEIGRVRTILLATGLTDRLPAIPGIAKFYGHTVHLCPYCDGYEYSDRPIAAYGSGKDGITLASMLLQWSQDVLYCTHAAVLDEAQRSALENKGVRIEQRPITELRGEGRTLTEIAFEGGLTIARDALFFATGCHPTSDLWQQLRCASDKGGSVECDPLTCETSVEGVYVAGDASRDVLQVASAIGEGNKAAVAINKKLLRTDGLVP